MNSTVSTELFEKGFRDNRPMLILRNLTEAAAVRRAVDAWKLGILLVEVPVQSDDGWTLFALVREAARGKPVGVGTVTMRSQVDRARDEGAAFIVSPGFDLAIAKAAARVGLPHLPGVATPTEVGAAISAGHIWLKAFPASVLGPGWVRALIDPFPSAKFVCVGGMTPDAWPAFREAGAAGYAMSRAYVEGLNGPSRSTDWQATERT